MFIRHKNQLINLSHVHDIRLWINEDKGSIFFYFSEEESSTVKFDNPETASKAFDSLIKRIERNAIQNLLEL